MYFFSNFSILPESPRWLLVRGHYEKANAVLKKIGDNNNQPLPHDFDSSNIKLVNKMILDLNT